MKEVVITLSNLFFSTKLVHSGNTIVIVNVGKSIIWQVCLIKGDIRQRETMEYKGKEMRTKEWEGKQR